MSKKTEKPRETHRRDGFILDWFVRRSQLEVNIYVENPDGTRGKLVSELAYPKVSGLGSRDWEPEAVSIAKKDIEKSKQEEK